MKINIEDATYALKGLIDCVALVGAIASFYFIQEISFLIKAFSGFFWN